MRDHTFGQPDRAHLGADPLLGSPGLAPDDELRRPAADIQQQERGRRRPTARRCRRGTTGGPPPRPSMTRGSVSTWRPDRRHVQVAVRRVAHGAGRGDANGPHPQRPRPTHVSGEDAFVACDGLGVERTRGVDALAKLRDHHVARQLEERTVGRPLDHEQPARVGPLVDHRDPLPDRVLGVDRFHPLGDPGTDDVVAPGEMVRVVRVQTLDPATRAADASPGARRGKHPRALLGGLGVCSLDRRPEVGVVCEPFVQPADRTVGFEARDRLHRVGAGEPERGREGFPADVERVVADHQGMPDRAPHDHLEPGGGLTPELVPHDLDVGRAVLARHRDPATCACARWRAGNRPGAPRSGA